MTQRGATEEDPSGKGKKKVSTEFAPFQATHLLDDMLVGISFLGSSVMLGSTAYAYLMKLEWADAKPYFWVSVPFFAVLFALQALIKFFTGPVVFRGTRKLLSDRVRGLLTQDRAGASLHSVAFCVTCYRFG